jgi:glycosyltransferase involved in cell wall biosynthesis
MQAKVSMVVPCYNKAPYIGEMLDSVIAQVWDNIELILVNDGSTDGTREIISVYEPKLRARGYELVIIDQENQGVAAAVRNGMLRMTGEYFCTVDCDDIIDREYVSAMAAWLSEHPDCDRVVCDVNVTRWECGYAYGQRRVDKESYFKEIKILDAHILEKYLLYRAARNSCAAMTRISYIIKCKVIENFAIKPRATQEPQLLIPLAAGRGETSHIRRILYTYRLESRELAAVGSRVNMIKTMEYQLILSNITIGRLNVCDEQKKYLMQCAEFGIKEHTYFLLCMYHPNDVMDQDTLIKATVHTVNEYFSPNPRISVEETKLSGGAPLFHAVSNNILKQPRNEWVERELSRCNRSRIIGYGAFGVIADRLLPSIYNTPMKPDVLWDIDAGSDCERNGIKVIRPNFDMLTETDTVLVFLKNAIIAEEICDRLEESRVGNYLCYFDILDYLATFYFPQIAVCGLNARI